MIFFNKNIFLLKYLLIFLVFVSIKVEAQVKIYPKETASDTIDFGMRYFENEEILRSVVVENNTNDTLYMGNVAPTFATVEAVGYGDTHLAFDKADNIEKIFLPFTKQEVNLKFYNDVNLIQDKGNMASYLFIGLVKKIDDPNSLIFQDTFFLFGRASDKLFTLYDNYIEFDSTFVGSNQVIEKSLFFRNNSKVNFVRLASYEYDLFTSQTNGEEFIFDEPNFPILLASRTNPKQAPELIKIRYSPKDIGFDSCRFIFNADLNDIIKDSIARDTSIITGYGVKLDYEITNSNFSFSNESELEIDLGDVKTNKFLDLNFELLNNSNVIINIDSLIIIDSNVVITSLKEIYSINTSEKDFFQLKFLTKQKGLFNYKLLLKTDFGRRKISGFEEIKHKYLKVSIKGKGIEPSLVIPFDTLNLGNISSFGQCNDSILYTFSLKNSGNDMLEILDYYIEDPINFNFYIDKQIVNVNDNVEFKVTFNPFNKNDFRKYETRVVLITNMSSPRDSLVFYINANFIKSSSTELKIPNFHFKPGSQINIPVLVNFGNLTLSNRFSTTLTFDNELLKFNKLINENTASVNSDNTNYVIENDKGIILNIQMPSNQYFTNSDTLCILNFDTFIARERSTIFVMEDPTFGDNDCDNMLPISYISGKISADSIPNIDNIFYNFEDKIKVSTFPNPVRSVININLSKEHKSFNEIDLTTLHIIKIFNMLGNIVYSTNFKGNNFSLDVNDFNFGTYYISVDELHFTQFVKTN